MPPTTVSRVDCQRKVADLERRVEGQKDKSRAEVQELPAGSSDDDEPYDDDDLQGQLDDAHEALEQARQLEGKEVEAEARKRRSNKKKKGGAEEGEGGSEGDGEGEGEAGVDKVEIEKDDDDPYRSFGRYVYCKANGNTALEALDLEVVKQKVEGLKAARGACQGGGGGGSGGAALRLQLDMGEVTAFENQVHAADTDDTLRDKGVQRGPPPTNPGAAAGKRYARSFRSTRTTDALMKNVAFEDQRRGPEGGGMFLASWTPDATHPGRTRYQVMTGKDSAEHLVEVVELMSGMTLETASLERFTLLDVVERHENKAQRAAQTKTLRFTPGPAQHRRNLNESPDTVAATEAFATDDDMEEGEEVAAVATAVAAPDESALSDA